MNLELHSKGGHERMPPMSTVVMQADGTPKFAGMSGFMFNLVVEALRFKYVIKLPPDYSWGARDAHGNWAGQFGMVVRNESDMLVGPVAPTFDRASALEPLPQFYYTEAGHCGGLTDLYVTNVFGYVNSFDLEVWIGLISAMLFVSLIVAMIDASFRCSRLAIAYYYAYLNLFSIFLMEASPRITIGSPKRWLIGTWWLAVFVLSAGFTGHMKASLTTKDMRPRLDTLHDIMESKHVLPVIIRGTTYEEVFRVPSGYTTSLRWNRHVEKAAQLHGAISPRDRFADTESKLQKNSPDINQRMIWAKANRLGGIMPVKDVFSKPTFDDVLQSKKVVFLDQTLLYNALLRLYKEPPKGLFYMGREMAMNLTMGMWVRRDLPASLRKTLHQRTRWIIESGLPEWHRLSIIERAKQQSQAGSESAQHFTFHTIKVEDVSGLFYLLLACFSICFVAILLEQLVYAVSKSRCCRPRRQRSTPWCSQYR